MPNVHPDERTPLLDPPARSQAHDETLAAYAERIVQCLLSPTDPIESAHIPLNLDESSFTLNAEVVVLLYARYILLATRTSDDDSGAASVVAGVQAALAKERAIQRLDEAITNRLDAVDDDTGLMEILWTRYPITYDLYLSGTSFDGRRSTEKLSD